MPRFRSRRREITAEQYQEVEGRYYGNIKGVCVGGEQCESEDLRDMPPPIKAHVHMIHGQPDRLEDGDWVVPESDGVHFYAVDADVMESNWEQITS